MKNRKRYITYNICVWLTIFFFGATFLVAIRHYGRQFAARHDASKLVDEAEAAYDLADFNSTQQKLISAHLKAPEIWSDIVERFGPRIAGLPNVMVAMERDFGRQESTKRYAKPDTLVVSRYLLATATQERAEEALSRYSKAGGNKPESHLWLARLALDKADFESAQPQFDDYWDAVGGRAPLVQDIKERYGVLTGPDLAKTGLHLFEMGLWREAFEVAATARMMRMTSPETRFLDGVFHDLDDQKAEAIEAYYDVIAERPGHLLSLKRLAALK